MRSRRTLPDSRRIGDLQKSLQQDEFRRALRALLMTPLMSPEHEDFAAVRRQAERVRDWFARETGWPLRHASDLLETPPPTADELAIIRRYDPRGFWTGRQSG